MYGLDHIPCVDSCGQGLPRPSMTISNATMRPHRRGSPQEATAVNYILGIDEGTTSARAFITDLEGNVKGMGQAELTQIYPSPGWIEHDPQQIISTQLEVIRAALRQAGISPSDLSAAGLTTQRVAAMVGARSAGQPL